MDYFFRSLIGIALLFLVSFSVCAADFATQMAACQSNLSYYHTNGQPNAICFDSVGNFRVYAYSDTSHSTTINWWAYVEPTCTSPAVINHTTHLCENPVVCTAGTKKDLTELTPAGITLTIYMGLGPALSDGGCKYQCDNKLISVLTNTDGDYSKYSCTQTGQNTASGDKASAAQPSGATPVTVSTGGNQETCRTVKGKNVCTGGTDIPAGCAYVNSVKVCGEAANQATMDTKTSVKSADSKNCVRGPGDVLCIQDPAANDNMMCGLVNGVKQCYSYENGIHSTGSTTTVANPDGTTTTTIITHNNILGENDGVKTTTCTGSNCTTTQTGGDTGTLDDAAKAAMKAECEKPGNFGTVGCSKFGDSPVVETISVIQAPATMPYTSWGSGSCPSPVTSVHGLIVMDYTPMCDKLSLMKPILITCGLLSALFIVSGAVKD